jgi:hypothetical protein
LTVEISKVKDARKLIELDLEWLIRQINDERAQGFQAWVDRLNFGVPKNLSKDITAYQAEMKPYFGPLLALRDKLKAELAGIEATISKTAIVVTDEVKRYLPQEEVKEPVEEEKEEEKDPGGELTK